MTIEAEQFDEKLDIIPTVELDPRILDPIIAALRAAGYNVSHKYLTFMYGANPEAQIELNNIQEYEAPLTDVAPSALAAPHTDATSPAVLAATALNCCWTQGSYCCDKSQPIPSKPGRFVVMKMVNNNPVTWKKVGEGRC